ncbi:hypothetical protein [Sinorhizobium fredii]|uniref:hypothetical protein n=1 Tax=Rhizobium fredii TaxID=380 RepID=UPI0002F7CC68
MSKELFVPIDALIFPKDATAQPSARDARVRQALSLLANLSDRDLEIAVRQLQAFAGD